MSIYSFLVGKADGIFLHIASIFILFLYLYNIGNDVNEITLIIIAWIFIVISFYTIQFYKRKKYFDELLSLINSLDEKYLISEMIDTPKYSDAVPYYDLLKKSNKSMLEKINSVKNERKEYKEYIEQWIHEIKTPIAAVKLISENNKNETTRSILYEIEKVDGFVEQVLFFARSEHLEQDYLIREIDIQSSINSVLAKNKQMFLQNTIKIKLRDVNRQIYSDSKWIEFIIGLILENAIKYKNKENPTIEIYCEDTKNGVILHISDNGQGIKESEISRVFEKGFTGTNGRRNKKSTGIGLYLCRKLCRKLDHEIKIESKENQYTKVSIIFPKGSFVTFEP